MSKKQGVTNNSSPIKLHHFGEPLVATIIKELGASAFFDFLRECAFFPDDRTVENKNGAIEVIAQSFTAVVVDTNVELISDLGYSFDSEHTIDVALLQKKTKKIYPIEIKMGISGSLDSWGDFRRYIKKGIKPRKPTKKGIKYLDGSMSSILANQKNVDHSYEISASKEDIKYSWDKWCLCIREKRRQDFNKKKIEKEILNPPLIFTFESLVNFFDNFPRQKDDTPRSHMTLVNNILQDSNEPLRGEISGGKKLYLEAKKKGLV